MMYMKNYMMKMTNAKKMMKIQDNMTKVTVMMTEGITRT